MNIIRMTGGLGNQMFQYALYLKYKSLGIPCKFEDWTEYENHDNRRPILLKKAFGIDYPVASMEEYTEFTDSYMDLPHRIARKVRGRKTRLYNEASFDFDPLILKKDNAYITGFFQTDRYFPEDKDIILDAFTFTDEVKEEAKKVLMPAAGRPITVGIHIRRGDYLDANEIYGNICTEEYYLRGIEYIEKCLKERMNNVRYLIFSNDPDWAEDWAGRTFAGHEASKSNSVAGNSSDGYVFPSYTVLRGTTEDTGYIDMFLMSKCDHNIIANSSFSWWGAYLNRNPEKIVIAPSKWTNTEVRNDIFTKDMIRI